MKVARCQRWSKKYELSRSWKSKKHLLNNTLITFQLEIIDHIKILTPIFSYATTTFNEISFSNFEFSWILSQI